MQHTEFIKGLTSYKNFVQDNQNNRLFHSIMLINKDGEFLRAYANMVAREILSFGREDNSVTEIKVQKEIHPDLFILGREKPIDASEAKELVANVLVAPYEGDKKVYIIEHFDEIQPAPANKLLKTLEEPPTGVTFILLVKNETRVLQTLLSRSQKFYLEGFTGEYVAKCLSKDGISDAELISVQAGNSLEEARKLGADGNSRKLADFVLDTFLNFKKTTELAKRLMLAEEFKEGLGELFSFFSSVAEMAIRVRAGKEIEVEAKTNATIKRIAEQWNYLALVMVIEATLTAIKMMESYVSVNNCLDQFFLKILEVRRKCRVL